MGPASMALITPGNGKSSGFSALTGSDRLRIIPPSDTGQVPAGVIALSYQ